MYLISSTWDPATNSETTNREFLRFFYLLNSELVAGSHISRRYYIHTSLELQKTYEGKVVIL